MKSIEELNALKKEYEVLYDKLAGLNEEEPATVTGGSLRRRRRYRGTEPVKEDKLEEVTGGASVMIGIRGPKDEFPVKPGLHPRDIENGTVRI